MNELDAEDLAEAADLRRRYLQRVQEIREKLQPWQGGRALMLSYGHLPTQSPFSSTAGNSVLEIQLVKNGRTDSARVRCIAVWRVLFHTFWSPADIKVQYVEQGLVPLVVSDGERLRVECIDVEVVEVMS